MLGSINNKYFMAFIMVLAQANIEIRKSGWLDRLVEYHKQNFIQDLRKLPSVQLKAKVQTAPPGYIDSEDWDYSSVMHLLTLIKNSKGLGPVRKVLRFALQSTRRMSIKDSLKLFPSLKKHIANDLYYEIEESIEYYNDANTPKYENKTIDDAIIIVSNPVEARLPSAMISVNLLREILENRAHAARYMPKTKITFVWKPMNKTKITTNVTSLATTVADNRKFVLIIALKDLETLQPLIQHYQHRLQTSIPRHLNGEETLVGILI